MARASTRASARELERAVIRTSPAGERGRHDFRGGLNADGMFRGRRPDDDGVRYLISGVRHWGGAAAGGHLVIRVIRSEQRRHGLSRARLSNE